MKQRMVDRTASPVSETSTAEGHDKDRSMWLHLVGKPSDEDIKYDLSQSSDPRYVRMTTRKEIWAWYLYEIATMPSGMIAFMLVFPVYLSIIATRYACKYNTPNGCDYYGNPILAPSSLLVVYIGNWGLKPESFATLMISLSGAIQAFGYLWLTSIADYSNYHGFLFRWCIIIGNSMIIAFFFIPEANWLFIGIFGAVLLVPLGLAGILYNAFLPVLVGNHWLIRRLQRTCDDTNTLGYQNEYKRLLRSIQDEISQFGQFVSGVAAILAVALSAVGFLLLADVTAEITQNYGMSTGIDFYVGTEEYWMKPIIGVDIWTSNINITNADTLDTISNIHGIRFSYGEIFQNGSVYGVTDDSEFIISYDTDTVDIQTEFVHSHYSINGEIIQVNLYTYTYQETITQSVIIGIEFVMFDDSIIYAGNTNIYNYTDIIPVKPDNYPNYQLSGCQINTGVYVNNNDNYNMSMPIIYGYTFAFMDSKKGQYGSTLDNRLMFSLCGVWCLAFSIPIFFVLKSRRKDKVLPKSTKCHRLGRCPSICTVSFKDYYRIIRDATRYPNLFGMLVAWFVFSDASGTVSSLGILFGQNDLGMDTFQLLILLVVNTITGICGNIFFIWFQKTFGWSSKNLVVLHLIISTGLPIWAIFGLFEWSPIGLLHVWEMYVIAGLFYGSQLASLYSSSRSLYAHLIPEGKESQFFGLYALTDKGSSWIGPLVATFVSNQASLRYAIIYILLFYLIAIPIVQFAVNYEQGMIDAGKIKAVTSVSSLPHVHSDSEANGAIGNEESDDGQTSILPSFNVTSDSYGALHS